MFRKLACVVAICTVLPLAGAYASGPLYPDHHASEPAVSPGLGRIYIYRPEAFFPSALEPAVKIDGAKVGRSEPGTYFYVDRPPGTYTISTTTEKDEPLSLHLDAGQTVYIRFRISAGFIIGHVIPALVDEARGLSEIKLCQFLGTGAPPAATDTPAQTPPKD
jgi:hypothetical protein